MEEIFCRLKGIYGGPERIWDKKVAIIGLGSGGNDIALDLARCGLGKGKGGKLILIDPDRLQPSNLSRYTACSGVKDLGKYKVDVVAEKLAQFSPNIRLYPYPVDFESFYPKHKEIFHWLDLVISATGSVKANLYINRCAWRAGIPAIYGGVWKGAFGGEVLKVIPGETPCYDCVLGQSSFLEGISDDPGDYGQPQELQGMELAGQPGLGMDVRFISLIQSKVALLTLLDSYDLPSNYIFIGNRREWIFKRPFQVFFVMVQRRGDCGTCKAKGDVLKDEGSILFP